MATLRPRKRVLRPAFTVPPFDVIDISMQPERVDWGLEFLEVSDLWHLTGGGDVLVGVVDTGVATAHPDLGDAVIDSQDFSGSPAGIADEVGHGTHVAGIIGARVDGKGITGVAPLVSLLNAKVLRRPREPITEVAVAGAIRWCIELEADLICLSLQSAVKTPKVRTAIVEAVDAGIATICAAGNTGPIEGSVAFPAAYPETIAVGYVTRDADGNVEAGLDTAVGREIDLVAPGGEILSTFPPDVWAVTSGTSMAAPFACGVAALLLALRKAEGKPPLKPAALRTALTVGATDLGELERDPLTGLGLINPAKVLG
jgi:major intracellular serine protease